MLTSMLTPSILIHHIQAYASRAMPLRMPALRFSADERSASRMTSPAGSGVLARRSPGVAPLARRSPGAAPLGRRSPGVVPAGSEPAGGTAASAIALNVE